LLARGQLLGGQPVAQRASPDSAASSEATGRRGLRRHWSSVRIHGPNRLKTRALVDSGASSPVLRARVAPEPPFSKRFRGVNAYTPGFDSSACRLRTSYSGKYPEGTR